MATITIASPCPKSNTLTRRSALAGTAALGAVALPAGVAMAATVGDVDPGLAKLEAGYAKWQALWAEMHRLYQLSYDLHDKARADRPMLEPEPPIPAELLPYANERGHVSYGLVPEELKELGGRHQGALIDWRHNHPSLDGHPDHEASAKAERRAKALWWQASNLRTKLLAIPTRSPRGLLLKLAVAVEAATLEGIEAACEKCDWSAEELFPSIVADVRAMQAGGVA